MKRLRSLLLVLCLLMAPAGILAADDVPRITVKELKSKIDKGDPVVVVDVRTTGSWMASHVKIKGAVRMPVSAIEARIGELPMNGEVVTYCT